ncbi:hypothetical protein PR202_ga04585 [Eleusine coracana subsp. coracana]|uniref:NAC domain-containing protein n=1 Tax=Eleusine coracana subsp. coracana TaxID=191504 RepID=A0AAV5BQ85_ELECO|nr:hypothetical protein PR202_ga04585 [Eleusine coracana subsp. coracana]
MDLRSLAPGYSFVPKEKELVEFYLLPRARGQPDRFPGVDIIDDDSAASTQPWKLFKRHNRKEDDEPYFFVHGSSDAKAGARQERIVDGGFKWKSQRRVPTVLEIGGEKIKWTKTMLSLQLGEGGSFTEPHCPVPVRICHISFTGHGQKRKRIPDGYDERENEIESQPAPAVVAPPSDSVARVRCSKKQRNFDPEAEQVPAEMMEQLHGIGPSLAESVSQRADAAMAVTIAPPSGSRSGTTRKFGKEAQQVSEKTEHLDGEDCQDGSTNQYAAAHCLRMATMAFDQDYSGAMDAPTQQDPANEFITQMIEEMTEKEASLAWKDTVPVLEQQVQDVVIPPPIAGESSSTEHQYAYPRFCGAPGIGETPDGMLSGFGWSDFCLC